MIITDLKAHLIKIPLNTPFIISAGTQTDYEGILLELTAEDGTKGWGEASPSERVTGETTSTVKSALLNTIKSQVINQTPEDAICMVNSLEAVLPTQPSACCALDIALHDLRGKENKKPIKQLLGEYRDNIPISFTVVIGSVEESVKSAEKYLEQGAKVLKVKMGVDPEVDVNRIAALREAFGYDIKITGDANEGYNVDQAIKTLNQLTRYELEFVEQPVHGNDLGGLKKVKEAVEIPIMADESACTVKDVENLINLDTVDMINIKLMKCGGLRNAARITKMAEDAGMACQIGCMIETGVAITAGTHLALALKNIKYADLDGHTFLTKDIVTGHQITDQGINSISGRPGLGIDVNLP